MVFAYNVCIVALFHTVTSHPFYTRRFSISNQDSPSFSTAQQR